MRFGPRSLHSRLAVAVLVALVATGHSSSLEAQARRGRAPAEVKKKQEAGKRDGLRGRVRKAAELPQTLLERFGRKHESEARTQRNNGHNQQWTPRENHQPRYGIAKLSSLVRRLNKRLPPGTPIKAGGSRHSWSPVAVTDGAYIEPEKMRFIRRARATELRDTLSSREKRDLIRVGSGTTISEISRTIWKRYGKSLPVLGGFDGQTLAGALATGTHGSVLKAGLIDVVQSLDLVTAEGKMVRVEPENGITSPRRFRKVHPDWRLVQNNDVFHSSLINLGMLGVVHSYVIKPADRFYLNEVRTETTGEKAQRILASQNIYRLMETDRRRGAPRARFDGHPERAYYLDLLWNPHTDRMVVTTRHPLDAKEQRKLQRDEPGYFADPPTGNAFRLLSVKQEHSRPRAPEFFAAHLDALITRALEQTGRFLPGRVPGLVDRGLGAMSHDGYAQRSYHVFKNEEHRRRTPTQNAEISIPVRGDMYLKAMDVIRRVTKDFAAQGKPLTFPILMRFVKGTKAPLGPPEDVAMFDVSFAGDSKRTQRFATEFLQALDKALYAQFGRDVRYHWGKLVPRTVDKKRVRESYPNLSAFKKTREALDPSGRFANAWQKALFEIP